MAAAKNITVISCADINANPIGIMPGPTNLKASAAVPSSPGVAARKPTISPAALAPSSNALDLPTPIPALQLIPKEAQIDEAPPFESKTSAGPAFSGIERTMKRIRRTGLLKALKAPEKYDASGPSTSLFDGAKTALTSPELAVRPDRAAKTPKKIRLIAPSSLASAAPASTIQNPAPDSDPSYYQSEPAWAQRLALDAKESFESDEDFQKYREELKNLRPLARWMARFYTQIREDAIQRPPNILTLKDLLEWISFAKKFERKSGWNLRDSVLEGVKSTFLRSLPSEKFEGRELQNELTAKLNKAASVLKKLPLPEHLPALKKKTSVSADPAGENSSMVEFIDENPSLFSAEAVKAMDGPDYIVTKTVTDRLKDLMMLYSTDYREKFFPLLIGETAEGKSSLIKFMFSLPQVRRNLGDRAVPVVSIPVKEAMTRRELLGGKAARGIELGFLSLAAKNGWVLVLEELNEASGEFLKSLNDVLNQIRQQGFFDFEAGGKTVRIKAHPHFWIVGTENPEEGNYAISRTPHSPDFLKRWSVRYYSRFPPAEQAEIMRGLSARWYGEDFAARNGLSQDFFENLITVFHDPWRSQANSGQIGGDLQEPYEFNRRTLHRFLKRYLFDLKLYEAQNRPVDEKARNLLMARELMEAYGAELRLPGEKDALWDKINVVFKLTQAWGIQRDDIRIEVTGFYRAGGKLVVQEKLVPLEFPIRDAGSELVPGPEKRLTLVPSLAENIYRNLRNRQFHEHQFSTGPTGTAKTSEQEFVNHMLGEPLFSMFLDEQTPMSELHGGFLRDPATGEFVFSPGILARAMMYDPKGALKNGAMDARQVRQDPDIGGTLLINEGNASPILESVNPALDDGILNLSDGQHAAVAGKGFHVIVTMNPVGEGYVGYPLSGALKSRAQTVEHPGDMSEEELTEILLDKMTGLTRFQLRSDKN